MLADFLHDCYTHYTSDLYQHLHVSDHVKEKKNKIEQGKAYYSTHLFNSYWADFKAHTSRAKQNEGNAYTLGV